MRLDHLTKVFVALILFPMIHSCRQDESPLVKEIDLSIETNKRFVNLSQIADSVRYIRLATTSDSYLGEITKAIVTSNNIIVSDRYTNSIFVYDIN
ncbi:MAG: 6-bladed beta-propeller, partial [Bacteroidales bacterium]